MGLPLEGIRVVDLTQVISGPFATSHLANMGADVLKIEQPGMGDQGRHLMFPQGPLAAARQSSLFMAFNGGKRSMTLDLKKPEAREILLRLVDEADVFVQNFKAGTAERMGLGQAELRARNPRLVYCSISGYGDSGPRASAAAYDPTIQATSGMMSLTGFEGVTGPTKVGFWVTDMATGITGAFSIAAALTDAARTGQGRYIDLSMLDTAVGFIAPMVLNYLNCGIEPWLMGNGSPGGSTVSSVYPTGDGYIQIAAATQGQFEAQCRAVGRADMIDDERFATRDARLVNAEAMRAELVEALAGRSAHEWEIAMAEAGVPAAAVATVPQMLENPQIVHRRIVETVDPPPGLDGPLRMVGPPYKLDGGHVAIAGRPPAIGEHTDEVLRELGYDAADIAGLRDTGVI